MNTQHEQPLLLSVDAARRLAGIGRTLMYSKILSGEIESVKCNARRLIPRASLERFVQRLVEEQNR